MLQLARIGHTVQRHVLITNVVCNATHIAKYNPSIGTQQMSTKIN